MKINIRKKLKNILKKGKVKLVPFVTAIGLVAGCGVMHGKDDNELINSDKYINSWDVQDVTDENEDLQDIVDDECEIKYSDAESLRILNEYGYECEVFDTNLYKIRCDKNENVTYCDSLDEFREYASVKNPTYEDLRRAVLSNDNINGRYQEWLLEGIDNLVSTRFNFDLVALYCNLEKLQIVERTEDEIKNDVPYADAYFLQENATVVVCPDNVSKSVFLHEAIGHSISCVSLEVDGHTYKVCNIIPLIEEKSSKFEIRYAGFGLEEGKAGTITTMVDGSFDIGPYGLQSEQLRVFLDTLCITLPNYVNMTPCGLVEVMKANDVDRALEYIENVDGMTNDMFEGQLSVNPKYATEDNLGKFFLDYADDKLYEGADAEQITNQITSIILNGGYYNLVYGNRIVFDEINADELIYNITDDINSLDYDIKNKVYTK